MKMQPQQSPFRGWIATLSNGDTFWETPTNPGEKSAWQKLLDKLDADGLRVTGLRLQRGGLNFHALSQKQCRGYYQAYEVRETMWGGKKLMRQGCGSVVGDLVFITWIGDDGGIWQDIRPLSGEIIHTTLRNSHGPNEGTKPTTT